MLASHTDSALGSMRAYAWLRDGSNRVAVGLASGKTHIVEFNGPSASIVREFTPRHSRPCLCVAASDRHLAAGLDKVRNDYSLLVWDLALSEVDTDKPLQQYGSSEVVSSVEWLTQLNPSIVVAGMGSRWLRVYDIRQSSSSAPAAVIPTKCVHGIQVDPYHPFRMSSYSTDDNEIAVWDLRRSSLPIDSQGHWDSVEVAYGGSVLATDPICVLKQSASTAIIETCFSTSRKARLASLTEDADTVRIWDLKEEYSSNFDGISTVTNYRNGPLFDVGPLTSFSYVPSHEGTMLAVSKLGQLISKTLCDPPIVKWTPNDQLLVCSRKHMSMCQESSEPTYTRDFITRAKVGYGIGSISSFTSVKQGNGVDSAWETIMRMEQQVAKGSTQLQGFDVSYWGVFPIFQMEYSLFKDDSSDEQRVSRRSTTSSSDGIASPYKIKNATAAMTYTAALNYQTSFSQTSTGHAPPFPDSNNEVIQTPQLALTVAPAILSKTRFLDGKTGANRRAALSLCGHVVNKGDLSKYIEACIIKLERMQKFAQAGMWALLHCDVPRCVRSLLASEGAFIGSSYFLYLRFATQVDCNGHFRVGRITINTVHGTVQDFERRYSKSIPGRYVLIHIVRVQLSCSSRNSQSLDGPSG